MQSPLFTRAGIRRIERFGISATDGPSRGKRALATTVVSTHPEDNDPAPAQYGKHLADIPLTLRESGRRNCEFSRHRLALAFPALILSDAPIGQQPLFGHNSGMTKKRAVTGHGNTPRGNRCKPRSSSPRISNETNKPDHASTPLLSDEVRPSPTVETAEPADTETASGKVRRLSFSTQDSPPALPDGQDTPAVRAASSIRPKPGPPPCGRTEQPAAAPRTVRPYRCRPNKATKRRAKIIDSFRASAPNDARKRLPFVTRQARISAKQ